MRKTLLLFGIIIVVIIFWYNPKEEKILPIPNNGETIVLNGESEEGQNQRALWFERMHSAAPETDWRMIEYQNDLARSARRRTALHFRNDCGDPETLADGYLKGLWKERGSINQAGSVFDTEYDPVTDMIWLISAGGSLFKSDRLGNSWQVVNQDVRLNEGLLRFVPKGNGKRLLAFIGRLPHYSDDMGATWTASTGISIFNTGDFHDPVVLSNEESTFYVLSKPSFWNNIRLYKSTDQGESFSVIRTFSTSNFNQLALCRANDSDEAYILEKTIEGKGKLFRISPGADALEWLNQGVELNYGNVDANLVVWSDNDNTRLYTYIDEDGSNEVYQSVNGGESWTQQGTLPIRPWDVGMYVLPSNPDVLFTGAVDCYRSINAGQDWELVNNWYEYYEDPEHKLHADIMRIAEFKPNDGPPFLLVSNHGGLTLSEDYLFNQQNIGLSGLNVSQYYSVKTDPFNPNYVYAGSQDQGFQLTSSFEDGSPGIEMFTQVISGDYGHLVFTNNQESLWMVFPGGWVFYYESAQAGFLTASYLLESEEESVWLPPLLSSPVADENAIYMAGGNIDGGPGSYLIRLEAEGTTINVSQSDYNFKLESGGGEVSAMAIAPTNSLQWYIATTNGRIFYSSDGGQTWDQSLNFVPEGHYLYGQTLYVSQYDDQVVYLGGSGYSNPAVYRSSNGGATFISMSSGLPSTLVFSLEAEPLENYLFAATEAGPYVFVEAEEQWYDLSGECAPAQTYWSVEYVEALQTVRFGTYGRGIWDLQIDEMVGGIPDKPVSTQIKIFPNPTDGRFNLEISNTEIKDLFVRIIDAAGRVLYKRSVFGNAGLIRENFDLSHLEAGVYFIRLSDGPGHITQKLILY